MNLQNYYWFFKSALTPRFCDELIKYGNLQREQTALTGGQTKKTQKGKKLDEKDIKDLKLITKRIEKDARRQLIHYQNKLITKTK